MVAHQFFPLSSPTPIYQASRRQFIHWCGIVKRRKELFCVSKYCISSVGLGGTLEFGLHVTLWVWPSIRVWGEVVCSYEGQKAKDKERAEEKHSPEGKRSSKMGGTALWGEKKREKSSGTDSELFSPEPLLSLSHGKFLALHPIFLLEIDPALPTVCPGTARSWFPLSFTLPQFPSQVIKEYEGRISWTMEENNVWERKWPGYSLKSSLLFHFSCPPPPFSAFLALASVSDVLIFWNPPPPCIIPQKAL